MTLHECGWREALLDLLDEVLQVQGLASEELLKKAAKIVEQLEENNEVTE